MNPIYFPKDYIETCYKLSVANGNLTENKISVKVLMKNDI